MLILSHFVINFSLAQQKPKPFTESAFTEETEVGIKFALKLFVMKIS